MQNKILHKMLQQNLQDEASGRKLY